MIGVVCPFSRPQFLQNVLDNFSRQTHQEKVLILVENGRALGTTGSIPGHVVQSEPHRSHARNTGIQKVRDLGIAYWAIQEDDDWYGPDYLTEVWEHRFMGDVTGKNTFRLRGDDGTEWLMHPGHENELLNYHSPYPGIGLLAATLAGWTSKALRFEPGIRCGEEIVWYLDMFRSGYSLWSRGSQHFRLQRYADPEHRHTSPIGWRDELGRANAVRIG